MRNYSLSRRLVFIGKPIASHFSARTGRCRHPPIPAARTGSCALFKEPPQSLSRLERRSIPIEVTDHEAARRTRGSLSPSVKALQIGGGCRRASLAAGDFGQRPKARSLGRDQPRTEAVRPPIRTPQPPQDRRATVAGPRLRRRRYAGRTDMTTRGAKNFGPRRRVETNLPTARIRRSRTNLVDDIVPCLSLQSVFGDSGRVQKTAQMAA